MDTLDYLKLISININTPRVVIYDVAIAHGIHVDISKFNTDEYVQYITELIITKPKKKIALNLEELSDTNLSDLARFINVNEEWDYENLIAAYQFLLSDHKIEDVFENEVGLQTNDKPNMFNNCLLYKFCLENQIETRPYTNSNEMLYLLSSHCYYLNNINGVIELNNKINNLINDVKSEEEQILHSEIDKLKIEITSIRSELNELINRQDKYNELEVKYNELQDKHNTQQNEITKLTSQAQDLSDEISVLKMRIQDLTQDNNLIKFELNEKNNELNKIKLDMNKISDVSDVKTVSIDSDISYDYDCFDINSNLEVNNMMETYKYINDIEYLQINLIPTTVNGAVSLAALLFMKDISRASDPIKEYFHLKSNHNNYIPLDQSMNYWWKKNNKIFNLSKNFNPIFPYVYYTKNTLINNLLEYGLSVDSTQDEQSLYTLLLSVYEQGKYYPGLIPLCNKETYITCEETQDNDEIVCFGTFGNTSDAYTFEEFYSSFTSKGYFADPKDLRALDERQILSLLSCIQNSESIYKIKLITLITKMIEEKKEGEANIVDKLKSVKLDKLVKLLNYLLKCGMSMRGWTKGPYPLTSEETITKDEDELMINVNKRLTKYNSYDKEILDLVNSLPLVYYRKGTFVNVIDETDGKTIGDRINILINDKEVNEASCIRLSSNYLCHSAYKYLIMLDQEVEFDINKLSNIF